MFCRVQCIALVDQYGKQIIEMIAKSASPQEICTVS